MIPIGLQQLENGLEAARMNFNVTFENIVAIAYSYIGSNLFDSIITEGKKEFLKKNCVWFHKE